MFKALLYSGLVVTCFSFWPTKEFREVKMIAALFFAVALITAELYRSGLKPFANKWVLFLVAFIPVNIFLAPATSIDLVGINVNGFWFWQPFLKIIIFALLFWTISSHDFDEDEIRTALTVVVWCGFLVALYGILQKFGTDQFFRARAGFEGRNLVGGFLSHPNFTAPFVVLCLPFAFMARRWFMAGVMIVGVLATDSQMGWASLLIAICVYLALQSRKGMARAFVSASVICVVLGSAMTSSADIKGRFSDNERFFHWRQIFADWNGPLDAKNGVMENFSLTGRGLGSFRFVYRTQHPMEKVLETDAQGNPVKVLVENGFMQAHNDYLEIGYTLGWVGLGLFLMAVLQMVKNVWIFPMPDQYLRALLASVAGLAANATANFPLQIGTFAFYACFLCGLLHNKARVSYGHQ